MFTYVRMYHCSVWMIVCPTVFVSCFSWSNVSIVFLGVVAPIRWEPNLREAYASLRWVKGAYDAYATMIIFRYWAYALFFQFPFLHSPFISKKNTPHVDLRRHASKSFAELHRYPHKFRGHSQTCRNSLAKVRCTRKCTNAQTLKQAEKSSI